MAVDSPGAAGQGLEVRAHPAAPARSRAAPGALGQQQQPWASGTSLGMGMGRGQANSPQVGIRIKHGEGVCMKHLFLLLFQSLPCVKEKDRAVLADCGKKDKVLKQLPPGHGKRCNNTFHLVL